MDRSSKDPLLSQNFGEIGEEELGSLSSFNASNVLSEEFRDANNIILEYNDVEPPTASTSAPSPTSLTNNDELRNLLNEWDVPELEELFEKNKINLCALKYCRPHHIRELLSGIPLGVRIKFEHGLLNWQQNQAVRDEVKQPDPSNSLNVLPVPKILVATASTSKEDTRIISLHDRETFVEAFQDSLLASENQSQNNLDTNVEAEIIKDSNNVFEVSQFLTAASTSKENTPEFPILVDISNVSQPPQCNHPVQCDLINLRKILTNYTEGRNILKLAEHNILEVPESSKQILVDKIVDYFIQHDKKLNVQAAETLSSQIKSIFPRETTEYYYAPQKGKAPKGKLVSKYYNQIRKLKSSGLIEDTCTRKRRPNDHVEKDLPIPDDDEENMRINLKHMGQDRWEEVKTLWKATKKLRKKMFVNNKDKSVSSFLDDWPSYKHVLGYTLIEIDFGFLFPNAKEIYTSWELFYTKIFDVFKEKIKEKKCKVLLEESLENIDTISQDGKNTLILYLLHSVLVPTSKRIIKDGNKKRLQKYTIADSQEAFIIFGNSVLETEQKLNQKKANNAPIQPFLIVLIKDNNISEPTEFILYFDNIKYKFYSIITALDCCFKLFHVFDLIYPLECQAVWQFIQTYFYEIETKHDVVLPNLTLFINNLKKKA